MSPTLQSLSSTTIVLHWLVAAGVLAMLGFGLYIAEQPRGPDKTALIQIHKSIGVLLLVPLVARLWWRCREGWPAPVSVPAHWEQTAARLSHWVLLVTPVIMIASGIMRSITYARPVDVFGLPLIPQLLAERDEALNAVAETVHEGCAMLLLIVVACHVAAAVRHHVVKRDATLNRMLGRQPVADAVSRRRSA